MFLEAIYQIPDSGVRELGTRLRRNLLGEYFHSDVSLTHSMQSHVFHPKDNLKTNLLAKAGQVMVHSHFMTNLISFNSQERSSARLRKQ